MWFVQENDAESLRAKVRKLQAEVADSEDTISNLEAQVRKQRTGTVAKRAPAKVMCVCVRACVRACVCSRTRCTLWVSVHVVSGICDCLYMFDCEDSCARVQGLQSTTSLSFSLSPSG